jgi:hypothetical protein
VSILGPLNPIELLRGARRGVLSASRRLRPDHRAIAVRAVRFSPQNMVRLYLYVVVAPSRFTPTRPFDDHQVARARSFAADAFPEVFDAVPRSAEEPMTLFTVEGLDLSRERALYVYRTGLVHSRKDIVDRSPCQKTASTSFTW